MPLRQRQEVQEMLRPVMEEMMERLAADGEQRRQESVLALDMVAQLSVDQDDQAYMEAAANQTEALLDILTSPRKHVLPDIVPRLLDQLNPADFS